MDFFWVSPDLWDGAKLCQIQKCNITSEKIESIKEFISTEFDFTCPHGLEFYIDR